MEDLYKLQRNIIPGIDNKTVTKTMNEVFQCDLLPVLPSPDDVSAPVIVDIGAGLAMYDIPLQHYFQHRSRLYLVDKSVNQVQELGNLSWGGWHHMTDSMTLGIVAHVTFSSYCQRTTAATVPHECLGQSSCRSGLLFRRSNQATMIQKCII